MMIRRALWGIVACLLVVLIGCSSAVEKTDEAEEAFSVVFNPGGGSQPSYSGNVGFSCLMDPYPHNAAWGPHCNTAAGCNPSSGYCEACGHSAQTCCDGPLTAASGIGYERSVYGDATVMCFDGSCDSTHHCKQCGQHAGDACCPADQAYALTHCTGDHVVCSAANPPRWLQSGPGPTCVTCSKYGYAPCPGTDCDTGLAPNTLGICVECGRLNDEPQCYGVCLSDRLNPMPSHRLPNGAMSGDDCEECGKSGEPACWTGALCTAPAVVNADPGYAATTLADKQALTCGDCGLCGRSACIVNGAQKCKDPTAYLPKGDGICWALYGGETCIPGSPPSGGLPGAGAGGASDGGAGGGTGQACECAPHSGDTYEGIAKCGMPFGGPCDPNASANASDKSQLCAPSLGCVNGMCQPPSLSDNWRCPSGLDYCWQSSQAGLCEGNRISGGGGGGGSGGGGTGGGGVGGGGFPLGDDAGVPTSCDLDASSSARIFGDLDPCAPLPPCCEDGQDPPLCSVCYKSGARCNCFCYDQNKSHWDARDWNDCQKLCSPYGGKCK